MGYTPLDTPMMPTGSSWIGPDVARVIENASANRPSIERAELVRSELGGRRR